MAQRQFASGDTSTWAEKYGNGSDSALTISSDTTEAPIDSSCSGTGGTTSLSATNASFAANQTILIHQARGTGVGAWELNVISSYTAGTITTKYDLINTYTDSGASQAQVRVLPQYSGVTIDSSKTYTAKAWDGNVGGILAFLCNGTTTITGTIVTTGKGFVGGNAGVTNQTAHSGNYGEGTTGSSGNSSSTAANGNGGGGGYVDTANNNGGGGAGGGNGATGDAGVAEGAGHGGIGGGSAGTSNLSTVVFGGGGGGGVWYYDQERANGAGSAGGGIVLIVSKTLTVTGSIVATGNAGADASGGAGGGGAGGSILLKGQVLTLGSTLITATGGAKGNCTGGAASHGGAGSDGRIHADYLTSISGTTNPTLDSTQDNTLATDAGGFFAFL
jgi:hypothetical protein